MHIGYIIILALLFNEDISSNFIFAEAKNVSHKILSVSFVDNAKYSELYHVLTEVMTKRAGHFNCLVIIRNASFQDMFDSVFFEKLGVVPIYQILVDETEDLVSPNYNTLKVLQQIKQDDCRGFAILSNPHQVTRLLKFGDRYREINTRALFVLLHDFLLFRRDIHFLWKKIVNVLFIKQNLDSKQRSAWFELSTVPFPAPISNVLIPRRLEVWRRGTVSTGLDLFAKKTNDLRGHLLRVVTFPHFPGAQRIAGEGGARYGGVEIEVVMKQLKLERKLNFVREDNSMLFIRGSHFEVKLKAPSESMFK